MIVLSGLHQFRRRAVAYRNDYCTYCESTRLAVSISSFWWFHIFFVPVIPLGRHAHWFCKECGKDPRGKSKKNSGLVWAIIFGILFGATTILYWTLPTDGPDGDNVWGVRIFLSLCCLAIGFWILRWKLTARVSTKLALVVPASTTSCALCGNALIHSSTLSCPKCGVERHELPTEAIT
jgi:hypothetical protein